VTAHPLLTAPIGASLVRLGRPTTLAGAAQALASVADLYFVSWLGLDALAGVALALPLVLLTVTLASGLCGGMASAMGRAVNAQRREDARALVKHCLVVAMLLATVFALFAWTCGPALYRRMGGEGAVLARATLYANTMFFASFALWANVTMAALLRGGGSAAVPARCLAIAALVQAGLSGLLTLGFGEWHGLGVAGPGVALMVTSTVSAWVQARVLWQGKLGFFPRLRRIRLQARLFRDFLRAGATAALAGLAVGLAALAVTGLVGSFGTAALAGVGIALSLEQTLATLLLGLGAATTTMVGVATGARDGRRARQVALTGALLGAVGLGAVGVLLAIGAPLWLRLFTADPGAIAAGAGYLSWMGPVFWAIGLGICLTFACQGAGRGAWPIAAAVARLLAAAGGGWYAVHRLDLGLRGLFIAVATGVLIYALIVALPLLLTPQRPRS
jgi:putative MATE family efflux protein